MATRRSSRRRVSRKRRTSQRRVVRRRKARKANIKGSKVQVFRGTKMKTSTSGQVKSQLMKNKRGKVVSKKAHAKGLRTFKKNGLGRWINACMQARKNLGLTGFVTCKKGTRFYKETMKLYKK